MCGLSGGETAPASSEVSLRSIMSTRKSKERKKHCAWGLCDSDTRYYDRADMENVVFYPFPKPKTNLEKCRRWIKMCDRPHCQLNTKIIGAEHYVCSKHFRQGGPTESWPDPNPASPHDQPYHGRKRPLPRGSNEPPIKKSRSDKNKFTFGRDDFGLEVEVGIHGTETNKNPVYEKNSANDHDYSKIPAKSYLQDHNYTTPIKSFEYCTPKSQATQTEKRYQKQTRQFSEEIMKTDRFCFLYTGIQTVSMLLALFKWVHPMASEVLASGQQRKNKNGRSRGEDTMFMEFLITLVRIRRNFPVEHLSYLFNYSPAKITQAFTVWVKLLAKALRPLLVYPSKQIVRQNLPKPFSLYPSTRCVIDCTEFKVEKSARPRAQRATWSTYKHNNTFKLLVGITPNGTISYLSRLYVGSVSDIAIVKNSGFLNHVEENDNIMADRGFNIRHLLLPKKATLNMPAFSYGKVLSHKAVRRSRKIAQVRIHVERAIGRLKCYRILSGVVPLRLRFLLNNIVLISAVLCNLQPSLCV